MQLGGWVRNLPSGEVEIEVEGPEGLIESLIRELRTGNAWADVRHMDTTWMHWQGKYDGFDITY